MAKNQGLDLAAEYSDLLYTLGMQETDDEKDFQALFFPTKLLLMVMMIVKNSRPVQRCSVKKVFLKILQNSQENTCARVSFLIKFQAKVCKFIKKETLAQVCSCEFCGIFKNIYFYRTTPVAASTNSKRIKKVVQHHINDSI